MIVNQSNCIFHDEITNCLSGCLLPAVWWWTHWLSSWNSVLPFMRAVCLAGCCGVTLNNICRLSALLGLSTVTLLLLSQETIEKSNYSHRYLALGNIATGKLIFIPEDKGFLNHLMAIHTPRLMSLGWSDRPPLQERLRHRASSKDQATTAGLGAPSAFWFCTLKIT